MVPNCTVTCTTTADAPWTTITRTSTTIETITICKNRTSTTARIASSSSSVNMHKNTTSTSLDIHTQGPLSTGASFYGLNSTLRHDGLANMTNTIVSVSSHPSVSYMSPLSTFNSSFDGGVNTTTMRGSGLFLMSTWTPPVPTSAYISLGARNQASALVVAIVCMISLVIG
ncbi:hypothetical protein VFPPC_17464 [Pochonia chlamydosporia 170]|uniref:Uncharacterized protein n=1 Tax=Pochonia chlamydosporia 170 TaxID=1380566 RepID=A0A219ARJ7_METCM|nr:hypothetical protein VFPPC_17464 [Pochonia chlamydosporia 170]OWT43373.1 hypothetical protein VFPPC_17464 [Pochonia chlamydosporia 170]